MGIFKKRWRMALQKNARDRLWREKYYATKAGPAYECTLRRVSDKLKRVERIYQSRSKVKKFPAK
jgi:hypothetical protein